MSKYTPSTRPNKAVAHSINPHKDRIIELYKQGLGTRPIAREIGNGHTHAAVYKALIRWGVKESRENRPQWNKGKKFPKKELTPKQLDAQFWKNVNQRIMNQYEEDSMYSAFPDDAWATVWYVEQGTIASKASYARNRDRILQYQRERFQRIKHSSAYMERRTNYRRRYRQDPAKRIKHNLSVRMAALVRGIAGGRKFHKSWIMLGCTPDELKRHLESKFTKRMNWGNYGSYWHVDHITPISYFNLLDEQDMLRGCHYTNLQPLTAAANLRKGNRVGLSQAPLGI